jgi:hypothetical protein
VKTGKEKDTFPVFFSLYRTKEKLPMKNEMNAGLFVPVDVTVYFKKLAFLCMDN